MKYTIRLFQLLLAVFAIYGLLHFSEKTKISLAFGCLFLMFVLEKIDTMVMDRQILEKALDKGADEKKGKQKKSTFKPLNVLLESKNANKLVEAVHHVFHKLGLTISSRGELPFVDSVFLMPGGKTSFGLKVLSDVSVVDEGIADWQGIEKFYEKKRGSRLLIISSNVQEENNGEAPLNYYPDYSKYAEDFFAETGVVAMTTQTLCRIYQFCVKRRINPKLFLHLLEKHPGGIFRLEDYGRESK